eukprot:TRINITY_DN51_c0_g1_i13.p1 TRINITY_DN51_c0_g1~~TRINITY_DN51_c0_g1_i13.p1  ORF type:complete len:527 (+),score=176.89 TRINITY_DN51_c0_g1_i13:71-1651(+)
MCIRDRYQRRVHGEYFNNLFKITKNYKQMNTDEQLYKDSIKYSQEFINFLNQAHSVYHVSEYAKNLLEKAGFTKLKENETWDLKKGGKYFFQRNNTAIMAFCVGSNFDENNTGFKIVTAHLDSPCLQLAPISKLKQVGFNQACIQTYGGGLWHSWTDRDLKLGGKIVVQNEQTKVFSSKLWNSKKPLMKVANLAIHLQTAQEKAAFSINAETQLRPIISTETFDNFFQQTTVQEKDKNDSLPSFTERHYDKIIDVITQDTGIDKKTIFDVELQLSDSTPANLVGIYDEFISGEKIDDLICSYAGLRAFEIISPADKKYIDAIVLFDHEEIGSNTAHGAKSTLIADAITRIISILAGQNYKDEQVKKAKGNSFIISTDVTHSRHPNYADRAQINCQSQINKGLNVDFDPGQSTASSCNTRSIIYQLCKKISIPILDSQFKNGPAGGSTLGPSLSAMTSIRTVDVGPALLGMHSIRETAGIFDAYYQFQLCKGFFDEFEKLGSGVTQKNTKFISNSSDNDAWEIIQQI